MSKVSKLLAHPIKVEIDGEEFEFKSVKLDDLPLVMRLSSDNINDRNSAILEFLRKKIKEADPETNEEEINNIEFTRALRIVKVIFEASGLEDNKKKLDQMTAVS